jgi:uncharacterized protein (TIGR02453 family)
MLENNTLQFLKQLTKNNHKAWFDDNRKMYENAKANFIFLVENILTALKKKDTTLIDVDAKKSIFRINRDVRFSKNKHPYKTNLGAYLCCGGKKISMAGYYLHIEPAKSFIAGGLWMPMSKELQKVRQEIDYNYDAFKKIITNKKLIQQFGGLAINKEVVLTRLPKGYQINNPAIEYLKLKSFIVSKSLTDEEISSPTLLKNITNSYEAMMPFIHFLNQSLKD